VVGFFLLCSKPAVKGKIKARTNELGGQETAQEDAQEKTQETAQEKPSQEEVTGDARSARA
jgi:hypothetical protein